MQILRDNTAKGNFKFESETEQTVEATENRKMHF